jgi:hypothetical protein
MEEINVTCIENYAVLTGTVQYTPIEEETETAVGNTHININNLTFLNNIFYYSYS